MYIEGRCACSNSRINLYWIMEAQSWSGMINNQPIRYYLLQVCQEINQNETGNCICYAVDPGKVTNGDIAILDNEKATGIVNAIIENRKPFKCQPSIVDSMNNIPLDERDFAEIPCPQPLSE